MPRKRVVSVDLARLRRRVSWTCVREKEKKSNCRALATALSLPVQPLDRFGTLDPGWRCQVIASLIRLPPSRFDCGGASIMAPLATSGAAATRLAASGLRLIPATHS